MAIKSKRQRRRVKKKTRIEITLPTPERLAKGDIVRLESGQIKSTRATFLDEIIKKEMFYDEPDAEELYLALAFMMDLTERSGLFSSATGNISELSFISKENCFDMSAAEEWRHIMKCMSNDAVKTIVDILADMRVGDCSAILRKINHIRELAFAIESFKIKKII